MILIVLDSFFFVGATEDELWKIFEICGPISHVRIVRDPYSGMGRGFAYVNFKDTDGVQLALEMEDTKLRERVLRISLCNSSIAKKNRKMKNRKKVTCQIIFKIIVDNRLYEVNFFLY